MFVIDNSIDTLDGWIYLNEGTYSGGGSYQDSYGNYQLSPNKIGNTELEWGVGIYTPTKTMGGHEKVWVRDNTIFGKWLNLNREITYKLYEKHWLWAKNYLIIVK